MMDEQELDSVAGLTAPQMAGLEALLACRTLTAAAAQAGCSRRSLLRWQGEPAFRAELLRQRRLRLELALQAVGESIGQACTTLVALLGAEAEGVRRAAARDLLELGVKLAQDDLEERLLEVEQRLAALSQDDAKCPNARRSGV
jgi:HEAT repeat protein